MKSTQFFASIFTLIFVIHQISAVKSKEPEKGLGSAHKSSVSVCDLKDVGSKVEQLITKGVYTLADVVISLEAAAYNSAECFQTGLPACWTCLKDTWTEEYASVVASVQTYYSVAGQLLSDVSRELLICIHL